MVKEKTEKSYTNTALKSNKDLDEILDTLLRLDIGSNKDICMYLAIISQELVNLNVTLSGIADYYVRCEKQFDSTTEELTTLNVEKMIENAKNTLDPKYRKKFKEDQNGKD